MQYRNSKSRTKSTTYTEILENPKKKNIVQKGTKFKEFSNNVNVYDDLQNQKEKKITQKKNKNDLALPNRENRKPPNQNTIFFFLFFFTQTPQKKLN